MVLFDEAQQQGHGIDKNLTMPAARTIHRVKAMIGLCFLTRQLLERRQSKTHVRMSIFQSISRKNK